MEIACLGSRTLHAHRQLLAGGERIALGKRALDVISRLAEARGEVVTKDELMAAVWPGAIVEENALQAQVAALRKALGPDADRLKTIRGVGYRLDVDAPPGPPHAALGAAWPHAAASPGHSPRWRVGARGAIIALSVLAAVGTLPATVMRPSAPADTVQVEASSATGGARAALLARSLDGQILNVLNRSGIQTRDRQASSLAFWAQPLRRLRGTVLQDGARLAVDMRLEDVPSGTLLWSERFEGASADELATEASVAAARTISAIELLYPDKSGQIDAEVVALQIRGSDLVRSRKLREEATPRQIFEQVVSRAPRLAHGHAMLALLLTSEARNAEAAAQQSLLADARREVAKAIELDPAGAGAAFDARYFIARTEHPRQLAAAEQWLVRGLEAAPSFPYLWMRECRFLTEVGRARDALAYCQRALALEPYGEPIWHSYARALWADGDSTGADQTIDRAAVLAPDHAVTRAVRFELAAFAGHGAEAIALLQDPTTRPFDVRGDGAAVLQRYLRGHGRWSRAERVTLASQLHESGRTGDIPLDLAIMALASLGELEKAFELLRAPGIDDILLVKGSTFLFQPVTRPLRADPRFWTAAAELGLARYWASTGKWPDICRKEFDPSVCKSRTESALARR